MENGLKLGINLNMDTQVTEVVHYNYLESGAVIGINYSPYGTTINEPIGIKPNSFTWISMKSRKRMVKEPMLKIFPKDCHDGLHLDILKGMQSDVMVRIELAAENYLFRRLQEGILLARLPAEVFEGSVRLYSPG